MNKGYTLEDKGCYSEDSIDYADFAHPVASQVENNPGIKGILLCGSGNGINDVTGNGQSGSIESLLALPWLETFTSPAWWACVWWACMSF